MISNPDTLVGVACLSVGRESNSNGLGSLLSPPDLFLVRIHDSRHNLVDPFPVVVSLSREDRKLSWVPEREVQELPLYVEHDDIPSSAHRFVAFGWADETSLIPLPRKPRKADLERAVEEQMAHDREATGKDLGYCGVVAKAAETAKMLFAELSNQTYVLSADVTSDTSPEEIQQLYERRKTLSPLLSPGAPIDASPKAIQRLEQRREALKEEIDALKSTRSYKRASKPSRFRDFVLSQQGRYADQATLYTATAAATMGMAAVLGSSIAIPAGVALAVVAAAALFVYSPLVPFMNRRQKRRDKLTESAIPAVVPASGPPPHTDPRKTE